MVTGITQFKKGKIILNTKNKGSPNTAKHFFAVGQYVKLKGGAKFNKTGTYQITAVLPPRGNSLQYRIQNNFEPHEHVIIQDQLELVSTVSADIETKPVEQKGNKVSIPARRRNAKGLGRLL